jgi:heme/copper-type cytochrome/quinol oxidase subunit 2
MKIDEIIAKLATALVVAGFLIIPLGIWFYDDIVLPSQYPEGAEVYTLYWSATKGITADRINGWNYWQSTTERLEEIRVRQGDRVVLRLISADVFHGFALPAFGFTDGMIKPGDVMEIDFVADQVGSFKFFCTIRCGPVHEELEATLTVLPASSTVARAQIFR